MVTTQEPKPSGELALEGTADRVLVPEPQASLRNLAVLACRDNLDFPMKEFKREMSSGVPYYEQDLMNVVRQSRGVPTVPLVLEEIAP